jgi:hypothetical protein
MNKLLKKLAKGLFSIDSLISRKDVSVEFEGNKGYVVYIKFRVFGVVVETQSYRAKDLAPTDKAV